MAYLKLLRSLQDRIAPRPRCSCRESTASDQKRHAAILKADSKRKGRHWLIFDGALCVLCGCGGFYAILLIILSAFEQGNFLRASEAVYCGFCSGIQYANELRLHSLLLDFGSPQQALTLENKEAECRPPQASAETYTGWCCPLQRTPQASGAVHDYHTRCHICLNGQEPTGKS
jgi:hypothetical protein